MSALASLESFGEEDPFFINEDRADTVYKVNGLYKYLAERGFLHLRFTC